MDGERCNEMSQLIERGVLGESKRLVRYSEYTFWPTFRNLLFFSGLSSTVPAEYISKSFTSSYKYVFQREYRGT